MTLTFWHWGSMSSANLIVNYYNVFSFYYTSIKPNFHTKQPINYVVITWSLYFKVLNFDLDLETWQKNSQELFLKLLIKTNIVVYSNPVTTGVHKQLHLLMPSVTRNLIKQCRSRSDAQTPHKVVSNQGLHYFISYRNFIRNNQETP